MTDATSTSKLLVKIPAVTVFFWVIKVLSTTVGETLADTLNDGWGLGLAKAGLAMGIVFAILLTIQFSIRKYIPWVYWATVIAVSTLGTLITDNLHDNLGWQNWQTAVAFGFLLATVFVIWWLQERTLSIKTINTRKREAFYWMAILATFAMGTAGGDIFLDDLGWPLLNSTILFSVVILILAVMWNTKAISAVLGFWSIYILTRPLGASIGDGLSLPAPDGLNLGAQLVTGVDLVVVAALIVYLTVTKRDAITE